MAIFERDYQKIQMQAALREAQQGNGQIVIISGTVASGKTELMHHFAFDTARDGTVVLTATGSRAESALHLGIATQLFRGSPRMSAATDELAQLLDESARTAALLHAGSGLAGPADARVIDVLCAALLDLAATSTVVICVDDVQHADVASVRLLLSLAALMRSARMLIVLVNGPSDVSRLTADLAVQPHSRRIELTPLTHGGVASILAERLGPGTTAPVVAAAHRFTGGNPLLVHALADDTLSARTAGDDGWPDRLHVGDEYGQGVLRCLHRAAPGMLVTAYTVAALDDVAASDAPALQPVLGHLLGLDAAGVARRVAALSTAGLLNPGGFRHPAARAAVLRDIDPRTRAGIHRQAAVWLHETDEPVVVVARHLVAAGHHGEPWAIALLKEAAEQTVLDGRPEFAVDCLELALRGCTDVRERARLSTLHAQALWRLDPAAAQTRLPELVTAIRSTLLDGRHALLAAKLLLWFGLADDAAAALNLVDPQSAEFAAASAWLAAWRPALSARLPKSYPAEPPPASGPRRFRLDDDSVEAAVVALLALIYADRPEQATLWFAGVPETDEARLAPTWRAILSAVRAEAALRQGDLPTAERLARTAVDRIPLGGWGVAIGLPLSILLEAATAMGEYQGAARQLGHPFPDAMLQSTFGLLYLNARGRYALAVDLPRSALSDFETCGELMARWNVTSPTIVPWRTGAARALLLLGKPLMAAELTRKQLHAAGKGCHRTRGAALRVLAMTSELWRRQRLLSEAADTLQASGDQLELAYTLADLGKAHYALGDMSRGRLAVRRALRLADQCHAVPLSSALQTAGSTAVRAPAVDDAASSLSDAERRVASLAVQGHTNRQIARKLHITISTVEQHLTRSYRKLNVSRRSDLPLGLQPNLVAD